MANPHLVTAAHNIRRAIRDVDQEIQKAEADLKHQTDELNARINQLKQEERQHLVMSANSDSDMDRARHSTEIQQNQQEISEIERQIFKLKDDFRKLQADLTRKKTEYNEMATMLDSAS